MSHVPLDIRETEETEGTAGNSSGTGGDVIFFFPYQVHIHPDFIFSDFRSKIQG